jgi:hypothetical protein
MLLITILLPFGAAGFALFGSRTLSLFGVLRAVVTVAVIVALSA